MVVLFALAFTGFDSTSAIASTAEEVAVLPTLDPLNRTEETFSNSGKWSALAWDSSTSGHNTGRDTTSGWGPYDVTAVNGAYWNPSTFSDKTGNAVAVTMQAAPSAERYVSLWLDMANPGSAKSGYQLRWTATATAGTYSVTLSKWSAGSETVLASNPAVAIPLGTTMALSDTGGTVTAFKGMGGTLSSLLSAGDSTFSNGYTGIEGSGSSSRSTGFKAGILLGGRITGVPILESFERNELPLANGKWTKPTWAKEIGGVWCCAGYHGYGSNSAADAAAYWNPSTFSDSEGGVLVGATVGSGAVWEGERLALWLDMPTPGSARSGYEARFEGLTGSASNYKVEISKWASGARTVLATKTGVSLPVNNIVALTDSGGTLALWTGVTTFTPLILANDSTYASGYTGLEINGVGGTQYNFRAGQIKSKTPETTIASGPSSASLTDTSFSFTSNEAGSTFECSLDGAAFSACASPKSYPSLIQGSHTFRVRATNTTGSTDDTPAESSFYALQVENALPAVPVRDDFERAEAPLANGKWSKSNWAAEIGGSWVSPYHGYGSNGVLAGAYWNQATYAESQGAPLVAAVVGTGSTPTGQHFALWLDMPSPGSAQSGYEARFEGVDGTATNYKVELARWVSGTRTVLASKTGFSLPVGTTMAFADTGSGIGLWTGTSSFTEVLSAADSTYSSGYTGLEVKGAAGTDYDFRAGNVRMPPTTAQTQPATKVTATEAVLNGTVNPGGVATTYRFDYGTTTAYGSSVPVPPKSAGSGVTEAPVSEAISGLERGTTYHFRLVATNSNGTVYSPDATFTTSQWAIPPSTEPSGAKSSKLLSSSCRGSADCTAVGFYTDSGGSTVALAERWNGSNLAPQVTPNPAGAAESKLESVSCAATTSCTAVGYYKNSSAAIVPLAERWNGTEWTIEPTPSPTGATSSRLTGVSCTSALVCSAVGHYTDAAGNVVPMAMRRSRSEWKPQATADPTETPKDYLHEVSCVSSTECWAVGQATYKEAELNEGKKPTALAEHWDGTEWTVGTLAEPPASLVGVSCGSISSCVAVGEGLAVERWDGAEWLRENAPSPPSGSSGSLVGVSCVTESICTAVGTYSTPTPSSHTAPLAMRWAAGSWSTQTTTDPAISTGALSGSLTAVSCASASNCMAAGSLVNSSLVTRLLVESYRAPLQGDLAAPQLTATGAPFDGGNFASAQPQVNVHATDAGSGVTSVSLVLDGETLETVTQSCGAGGCSLDKEFKPDLSSRKAGNHTMGIVATDASGNSTSQSAGFVLDPSGPTVKLSGPMIDSADGPLASQTAQVDVYATDGTAESATGLTKVRMLVDGAAAGEYTPPCAPSCTEPSTTSFVFDKGVWGPGPHKVEIEATDAVGNARVVSVAVDVPDGPGIVLSGSLYQRRGQTVGTQVHKLDIETSQTDGSSVAPRPGVKSIEVRVDGAPEANPPTQSCAAGNCSMNREWSFTPTAYTVGTHTIEVRASDQQGNLTQRQFQVTIDTSDACADSAVIPSESCPPRVGEVDHAWEYTGNPSNGGTLVAEEWVQLGTYNARRQDAQGILTTRGVVGCTANETGKCGEVRSAPTNSADTAHNYVVTTGVSVEDPNLDRVADLRQPIESSLGAPVASGPLVDALKSWQDPPPNHGSTYNVYEIETEEEPGCLVLQRWWIDNQTGLPLRHMVTLDSSAVNGPVTTGYYFFSFDQELIRAQDLPSNFFLLPEPAPVDQVVEQTAVEGTEPELPEEAP